MWDKHRKLFRSVVILPDPVGTSAEMYFPLIISSIAMREQAKYDNNIGNSEPLHPVPQDDDNSDSSLAALGDNFIGSSVGAGPGDYNDSDNGLCWIEWEGGFVIACLFVSGRYC